MVLKSQQFESRIRVAFNSLFSIIFPFPVNFITFREAEGEKKSAKRKALEKLKNHFVADDAETIVPPWIIPGNTV